MKHILLTLSLILFAFVSFSQIVNADFEAWSAEGSCTSPDGWGTLNGSTNALGVCTVEEETSNPYGGSSALHMKTLLVPFVNQIAPGITTTGTINTNTQAVEGGQAFTERPTSFDGWYMAAPMAGDSYSYDALLINEVTGDTVGAAHFGNNVAVSTWTMFTAPVTYFLQDDPTLLQIIMVPSNPANPQVGSEAWFDDLSYQTLTVGIEDTEASLIKTFPNPVIENVFFDLGIQEEAFVTIYNVLGVKVKEQLLTGANNHISMSELPNGTYVWQFASDSGEILKTGKLLLIK